MNFKKNMKKKNKNEEEIPVEEQLDFDFDDINNGDIDDFDNNFDAFEDFEGVNDINDTATKEERKEPEENYDDADEIELDYDEEEPEDETEDDIEDEEYDEADEIEEEPEENYDDADEIELDYDEEAEEETEDDIEDEEYDEIEEEPEEDYDDEEYDEVDEIEEEPEEDDDDEEYDEVDEIEEEPEEDYEDEEYDEVDEIEEEPEEDDDDEEYDNADEIELELDEDYNDDDEIEEEPEEDYDEADEIELELDEDYNEEDEDEIEEESQEDYVDDEVEESEEDLEEAKNDYINSEESEESEENDDENIENEKEENANNDNDDNDEELSLENLLKADEDTEDDYIEDFSDLYPEELVDIELECIYVGLLFNNPKAISRYYLLYDDCRFSNKELSNLYRIIIFRDGEQYAPAEAKEKYQLPRENPKTYDLKYKVRKLAASKNYNLENVYIELKKLFILKKNYIVAATAQIRQKILEIQDYELYADMSVEEVESALEQITVTTGLSQAVLNSGATEFLLRGDTELSTGISLPFNILSTVFKGLRKGETMCYAMPSNAGKSRFTVNLACYIAFVHKQKVLVISNEMSQEKMRLCMITTILNNPEIQKLHGQKVTKTESELLDLKFRADNKKSVKCDEDGFILRKEGETHEEIIEKLNKYSKEFRAVVAATEWLNTQLNNSLYFIHITEHSNDDLKKIILNYYYKEGIEYMFYDTLKADTDHIGNGDEIKKTATILSNIAQKFKVFIASSMQLLESSTLPVNLNVNDMSASRTVKEVLDTLCLMKQINRQTLKRYEYSETDLFEKCHNIRAPKDTDVRFYACVVDKNRAGAKPTVLFKLNLAYNSWEEMGHLRLKQSEIDKEE